MEISLRGVEIEASKVDCSSANEIPGALCKSPFKPPVVAFPTLRIFIDNRTFDFEGNDEICY